MQNHCSTVYCPATGLFLFERWWFYFPCAILKPNSGSCASCSSSSAALLQILPCMQVVTGRSAMPGKNMSRLWYLFPALFTAHLASVIIAAPDLFTTAAYMLHANIVKRILRQTILDDRCTPCTVCRVIMLLFEYSSLGKCSRPPFRQTLQG